MRTQAAVAYRTEPVGSPAHEAAALAMGCASELLGCTTEAAVYLEEAAALGRERAGVTLLAQGQIARILLEAGSTDDAQRRALDGLELAVDLHLDEQTVSILLHAIAAALLAARDDATGARGHLDRALRLLPRTAAFPWLEIETRIVLARAGRTIGDRALSGLLLQEARRTLTRFGDPGVLPGLLAREERALERTLGGAGAIREPLTGAERRVLELPPRTCRSRRSARCSISRGTRSRPTSSPSTASSVWAGAPKPWRPRDSSVFSTTGPDRPPGVDAPGR